MKKKNTLLKLMGAKKIMMVVEVIALILASAFVVSIIAGSEKNSPPIVYSSSNIRVGKVPLEVNFDGSASDRDGNIVSYHWNFGDGSTSDLQNPTHVYVKDGKYTVTFTVTDDDGESREHAIIIYVRENNPPAATASASRTEGDRPLKVEFSGEGTDRDGKIASYYWDFDDGDTSNEQNPIHTYQSSGYYNAKLIVTDDNGATDMAVIKITVNEESDWEKWYLYYYFYYLGYQSGYYNSYYYGYPPWSPHNPYFWCRPVRASMVTLSKNNL